MTRGLLCVLQDILQNKDLHLDGILIASLVFDLIKACLHLNDWLCIYYGWRFKMRALTLPPLGCCSDLALLHKTIIGHPILRARRTVVI